MKIDKSPGWKIPPPIPSISLGISVDTFYNWKKVYSPGFTWSFEILKDELYEVECDLLDFLSEQTKKRQMDTLTLIFLMQKIGKVSHQELRIEYVKKTKDGWLIGDTY